ncbi:MAG: hypothetical protein WDO24_21210 [Pseudomonadota bacterium]
MPWRLDRITLRNRGANQLALIRDGARFDATPRLATMPWSGWKPAAVKTGQREGGQYVLELAGPVFQLVDPPVSAQATQLTLYLQLHRVSPDDHLAMAAELRLRHRRSRHRRVRQDGRHAAERQSAGDI